MLYRNARDNGPKFFKVNFELSVLAEDGSVLCSSKGESSFKRNGGDGFDVPVNILLRRMADYLPNNTLSVRCVMWKDEKDVQNAEQIVARTSFITEHISFFHPVEDFSMLQENEKHEIEFLSPLNHMFTSSLYFVKGSGREEKIIIDIIPSDARQILYKCKLHLLGEFRYIECGGVDNVCIADEREETLTLCLTRQAILSRKKEYLRQGQLTLLCQCTFSTELTSDRVEETQYGLPFADIKQKADHGEYKEVHEVKENLLANPSALDDMKALYVSQRLTDVQLKTKTKSFPAHKIVLCARSPVFEAMMTSDMKEKNTASIPVDDLEDDTVEQLLLFLYSDSLDNLEWESAARLYYAADKYQIAKLKAMCSSFLEENLNASNAGKLLLLADTHSDSNLQKIVEDFIMNHEEQVFGSDEWVKLMKANPMLAMETMHLKYKTKM